ncbi:MAG: peptidoglycan DD-metalloendopeptidase family protein [Gemmatimonadetes bacterium]|nr:peptidoglycan DD-metalloendopeptidase family protein [Gemmatimonadota bacterium]
MTERSTRARALPGLASSAALALAASLVSATPAVAQTDLQREIRDSQRRLEEIRAERTQLQEEMENLRNRVHAVSAELRNIERQVNASRSVLKEMDFQLDATARRIEGTGADLVRTRERLQERRAVLARRLRDIYKRGPLHTARVLLGAESFGDLLNRYRYLRLIASYDRTLVEQIGRLESELVSQGQELKTNLAELGQLRESKLGELAELRNIEAQHQRTLRAYRTREREAQSRLERLAEDERQLAALVTTLERRRREAERRRGVAGASPEERTLSTRDLGSLDWPIEGRIVYRFGRERRPNGTVLRWNGIGIGAQPGAPVYAVQAGTAVLAGPFEGYGPSVILSHGAGFYTLYLYLEEIRVREGERVEARQMVGTVGGVDSPEGPHIEFQVRAPVSGGSPVALDPLQWLKQRAAP